MSDTKALLEALGRPFPKEAVKTRVGGGGARFDYVAGYTVIHRLNAATGGVWDWAIKSFDFRPLPPDRNGREQSLVVVTGELTIPGLGTRAGIGVQKVSENGGEDLVKGASTDALKKAATLFGVALELYGDDFEGDDYAGSQTPYQKVGGGENPFPPNRPAQRATSPQRNGSAPARPTPPPAAPGAPQPALAEDDPLRHVLASLREMEEEREPWATIKAFADKQSSIADDYGRQAITGTLHAIAQRRKAAAPAAPKHEVS